ncbi:MAG TPA: Fe2+-dependent dioxygenase [Steroidobacteraceae bacterium]|nr:Fe2+-dependent dioxygenase [Steroidobacteraceae bacterium]
MLVTVPQLLSASQVAEFQAILGSAEWIDGKATAGYLSSRAKNNVQLAEDHAVTRRLGGIIQAELDRNQLFIAAALPLKVLPALFNRYSGGQAYGAHIDGAVQPLPGSHHRVRTDLSATIFLSNPDEYAGGELIIGDAGEEQLVKLPAGDMILYSGGTTHRVQPVTRGVRLAAFFWVQSMVRDGTRREILFELDRAIQQLGHTGADHAACVRLAGVYHNLLRQWADT